jgi:anti-sigma-K factor RskA
MSDIEIHHLGAAYALDALDDRERTAFEAHYGSCEICRADVRDYRATAAELGTLIAAAPPAALRARVLGEIGLTRQLSPLPDGVVRLADRRRPPLVTAMLAVAAAAMLFLAGALVVASRGSDDFGDQFAAIASAPDGQVARLGGGDGAVTVAWTGNRVAVAGSGLTPAGQGRAYELWLIDDDGAHAMRLLDQAADGTIERVVDIEGTPLAWGITIEPDQGSDTPTEPVLYVVEVDPA